jgi:ABC-type Zn uptake system ZnuABC Zn-binding protein ZnuA
MKKLVKWAGPVLAVLVGLAVLFSFPGCGRVEDDWKDVEGGRPHVLASFPPLYCFARNVAGYDRDRHGVDAAVLCLMTTEGPHRYDPNQRAVVNVRGADILLVNGLGLDEQIAEKLKSSSDNNKLEVVEVAEDAIPKQRLIERDEHEHEMDKGDKHEHEKEKGGKHHDDGHEHHGKFDPHVWLGLPEAILMVKKIEEVLAKADPAHKASYEKRARAYADELKELHADGKKALAGKKNRKLIATHDSLRYFARAFDLEVVENIQPQAGVEPNAADLARLVEDCVREKVQVITVEPQFSSRAAETLKRELKSRGRDVTLVEVDTLETADRGALDAGYYARKMRANIDNLAKHLK